jgi:hypothetical protein
MEKIQLFGFDALLRHETKYISERNGKEEIISNSLPKGSENWLETSQ